MYTASCGVSGRLLAIVAVSAAGLLAVQGALVAEWQFNNYAGGAVNLTAEYGHRPASATAPVPNKNAFSVISGTTLNEFTPSSPNNALRMETTQGNPDYGVLTLTFSGAGFSDFVLTYASRDNGESGYTQTWGWSVDGISFTQMLPTIDAANGTWTAYTVDFSGATVLNNSPTIYFQNTVTWTGNKKSVDFDNISITAVPEPIHLALGVFGLVLAGVSICRGWLCRLKR